MGPLTFPQMLCRRAVPAARNLPTQVKGKLWASTSHGRRCFSTASLHQQTLCSISLQVLVSILGDLQRIFSDYITSEKAFGPNYIIKDKTESPLALLPLVWKSSSCLIESTWFIAKLDGGHHLTDILDDSRGKRHPLFVLLSSYCHHPFPNSQEKLPALGLTLRGVGGSYALELAVAYIWFFDPDL